MLACAIYSAPDRQPLNNRDVLRHLLFIALLAALGAGCYDLGQRGARAYERILTNRIASGFEVLGHDWARIQADGLKISIHGHAPDTAIHDPADRKSTRLNSSHVAI